MKAAFAFWNGRIAPLFDTSRHVQVVEVGAGRILCQRRECFEDQTAVGKVFCLVEWGVGTLICGAISRPVQAIVTAHGIQVVPFVAGDLPDVTRAWLEGRIMEAGYAMPGYRVGGGGAGGGFAAGPGGQCVCPQCGHEATHQQGVPCPQAKCPKCGAAMVRKQGG